MVRLNADRLQKLTVSHGRLLEHNTLSKQCRPGGTAAMVFQSLKSNKKLSYRLETGRQQRISL